MPCRACPTRSYWQQPAAGHTGSPPSPVCKYPPGPAVAGEAAVVHPQFQKMGGLAGSLSSSRSFSLREFRHDRLVVGVLDL